MQHSVPVVGSLFMLLGLTLLLTLRLLPSTQDLLNFSLRQVNLGFELEILLLVYLLDLCILNVVTRIAVSENIDLFVNGLYYNYLY